jgi:hypothetical protein
VLRYIRAFFLALIMTLRGQKAAPSSRHPALSQWIVEAAALTESALAAAHDRGMDKTAREAVTMRIEGRTVSMETILSAVKYHTTQEYSYLLRNEVMQHSLTAIYATNMNDQYLVRRLHSHLQQTGDAPLSQSVAKLAHHLESIPSTETSHD